MLRKVMLGVVLVTSASSLYSTDASTQTESPTKTIIDMQRVKKAIDRGVQFIHDHRNTKQARIGGHALKASLGILAAKWSYQSSIGLMNHSRVVREHRKIMWNDYSNPAVNYDRDTIPGPPFFSYLAIAGYFLYDGCSGIYNELKT